MFSFTLFRSELYLIFFFLLTVLPFKSTLRLVESCMILLINKCLWCRIYCLSSRTAGKSNGFEFFKMLTGDVLMNFLLNFILVLSANYSLLTTDWF